jgi:hypothetical protein
MPERLIWSLTSLQGESYPENRPSTIEYQCDIPVSGYGHEPQTEIEIYCNDDPKPPVHVDSRTRCVATLSLDLNKVSSSAKRTAQVVRMGYHRYYSMEGAIEARYESARITYTVKLGGKQTAIHFLPLVGTD